MPQIVPDVTTLQPAAVSAVVGMHIWPGVAATYFYLGTKWVQTGWICDRPPTDVCTDSITGATIQGGHSA